MNAPLLFITGGTGFIGQPLVRLAAETGYSISLLSRSESASRKLAQRFPNVTPVIGDLREPRSFQDSLRKATHVIHLAQPQAYGSKVTEARANIYKNERERMDFNLLDTLLGASAERILYVGGTSYIGEQGDTLKDETTQANPKGWGPMVARPIELLPSYRARGLPILEAFPGWVYGHGSWYHQYYLRPLSKGRVFFRLIGSERQWTSPIHLQDCARALLHLLWKGQIGERYFVVDDTPARTLDLAILTAQAFQKPFRALPLPVFLFRALAGAVITEGATCSYRLSNEKLKATGFECAFPSIHEGIPDVVGNYLSASESR